MSNVSFSLALLKKLWENGVREFCVAAGSRNSPMLYALSKTPDFKIWTFYDEREAGFFALGRIIESARPVAVLTTSGTAAAELFPAVIEAHYSNLPLLCLTADRPMRYRGTGAPQAIEQKNLFGVYTEKYFELGAQSVRAEGRASGGAPLGSGESASLDQQLSQIFESVSMRKPLHLNLFFDEPLIDSELAITSMTNASDCAAKVSQQKNGAENLEKIRSLNLAFEAASRPLLLLGSLPEHARAAVKAFALKLQAPLYIEALSGLREDADLSQLSIASSERILKKNLPDLVLRIGGVPTCRFWRDLEILTSSLRIFSIDEKEFSGMVGSTHIEGGFESTLAEVKSNSTSAPVYARELKKLDQEFVVKKAELFSRFPKSELSVFAYLSRLLPEQSNIFLGNSMSVREWDLCALNRSKNFSYFANRGANGIDGELSTFLGGLKKDVTNVAILGDLTALYSLSAPWVARELEDKRFLIFVINNAGGKIFSRLPAHKHFEKTDFEKLMELKHSTTFKAWAELWNLGYACWSGEGGIELPAFDRGIVELKPDALQSDAYWKAFDELWK